MSCISDGDSSFTRPRRGVGIGDKRVSAEGVANSETSKLSMWLWREEPEVRLAGGQDLD